MNQRIGFIGVGVMGRPMALNLLHAGYQVVVFDRLQAPVMELINHGASAAASIKQLAKQVHVIISMLPNSPHVMDVMVTGEDALIHHVKPGTTVVDMSSISPDVSKQIYEIFKNKQIPFIEAPVSGGQIGAVSATLTIMVGGDEPVFQKVQSILSCLGKKISYMGPIGTGQMTKICNQIMVAGITAVMSEGLALGKTAGLDLHRLRDVLCSGRANSWQLENKGTNIINGEFVLEFKSGLMLKDLNLAVAKADSEGLKLELLEQTKKIYEKFVGNEGGDIDYTGVIKQIYPEFTESEKHGR